VPPHGLVHKVSEDAPAEELALVEPLAVAVRAVRIAGVTMGDTVVVQGPGPIGLMTTVAAQLAGATTVVLVGAAGDERRLEIGTALGASYAVQSRGEDLRELVSRITGGHMAERVLDATGAASAFWQGVQLTARGGVYLNLGSFQPDVTVAIYPNHLMRSKIDLRFSHTGANCFQDAIRIVESRRFPLHRVVTRRVSLDETEAAFVDLLEHRTDDAKVVVDPAA
jgi:threonine dehydrogenase-like Zn-dependent dehydrogenase